jgi:hypothetical protein
MELAKQVIVELKPVTLVRSAIRQFIRDIREKQPVCNNLATAKNLKRQIKMLGV